MDASLLDRVMKLAAKTGDRVIVVNPESGTAHVLLPFDAYESLAGGADVSLRALESGSVTQMSRDELVDKINKEIAAWNTAQQSEKEIDDLAPMDILDDEVNEEHYYLEPIE